MRGVSRWGSARRWRWDRCRAIWSPTRRLIRSVSRRDGDALLGHHLAVAPDFLLVVLPVEDVPLVRAFLDRALLGLDLPAHERVDGLVRLHLVGDHLHDLLADLLGVGVVLDFLVLVQMVEAKVRQPEDLLARQLHRMMPFSLAIFFLSILNMSV